MYKYSPAKDILPVMDLPVMPGTPLFYVDPNSYEIYDDDIAEGIALMNNQLYVVVDGELSSLNGPYFLSRAEAQSWIDRNRKPTLQELLADASWKAGFPAKNCKCYVQTKSGQIRTAYFDRVSDLGRPSFFSFQGSCRTLDVSFWTEIPIVEKPEW